MTNRPHGNCAREIYTVRELAGVNHCENEFIYQVRLSRERFLNHSFRKYDLIKASASLVLLMFLCFCVYCNILSETTKERDSVPEPECMSVASSRPTDHVGLKMTKERKNQDKGTRTHAARASQARMMDRLGSRK